MEFVDFSGQTSNHFLLIFVFNRTEPTFANLLHTKLKFNDLSPHRTRILLPELLQTLAQVIKIQFNTRNRSRTTRMPMMIDSLEPLSMKLPGLNYHPKQQRKRKHTEKNSRNPSKRKSHNRNREERRTRTLVPTSSDKRRRCSPS